MSLPERLVVLALLVTALFSTLSGWLFQVYTDTICHQKLLLTFLLSTLFWVGLARHVGRRGDLLQVKKKSLVKDISRSTGIGIGLVALNQVLIIASAGLFFKLAYNCEVLGGWSQELIVNNLTANAFSFGLIFALVQWNAFNRKDEIKPFPQSIWIKDYSEQTRLPVSEIVWVQTDNNCIHVHSTQRKFVVYRSLKSLEAELDPSQFVRVHRSKLVNREFIAKLKAFPSGDGEIQLSNGQSLRYSRTFKGALLL
ncbi:MAG: LytTR family transcriptional regulator [Roseivirga sp.]|nr:LytTR family transcriptional regulator [Roseivirga sp.]MCE7996278.1 LytTR family transcriptional regulator [Roseivirga sp.]